MNLKHLVQLQNYASWAPTSGFNLNWFQYAIPFESCHYAFYLHQPCLSLELMDIFPIIIIIVIILFLYSQKKFLLFTVVVKYMHIICFLTFFYCYAGLKAERRCRCSRYSLLLFEFFPLASLFLNLYCLLSIYDKWPFLAT